MHTYETLFIATPTLSEDEERSTVETLAAVVTDGGGTMVANDRMGRRRLAYPIQKFEDGIYIRFLYDAAPAVPIELERRIRLSDKVLRSLTVRLREEWASDAKKQVVIDAERRAQAEAEAKQKAEQEAEAAAAAAGAEGGTEAASEDESVLAKADDTAAADGDDGPDEER